jgi:hypothetical protein
VLPQEVPRVDGNGIDSVVAVGSVSVESTHPYRVEWCQAQVEASSDAVLRVSQCGVVGGGCGGALPLACLWSGVCERMSHCHLPLCGIVFLGGAERGVERVLSGLQTERALE